MAKKILIVDDKYQSRILVGLAVDRYAPLVTVANNGREALDILKGPDVFDLIVLDLLMPQVSGWEVLEAIRQGPRSERTPVVILSGAILSDRDKAALKAKAATLVEKDTFSLAEFEKLLAGLLDGRHRKEAP